MPKHPIIESYIYQFLTHCRWIADAQRLLDPSRYEIWERFILSLKFTDIRNQAIRVAWTIPQNGSIELSVNSCPWYTTKIAQPGARDACALAMESDVRRVAKAARMPIHEENTKLAVLEGRFERHFVEEERLFDRWAISTDPQRTDVELMNESLTAPEMRYIHSYLGDVRGKRLMDVGCGLGEASVYFAIHGARVTAVDLSSRMLDFVGRLAKKYSVSVERYRAAAEHLHFSGSRRFDIVYAGNVFHHIDIHAALREITRYMNRDGVCICWEPVSYNPFINIYRRIATRVRSFDERPIRKNDIQLFRQYFKEVHVRWFWLTTLVIFFIMIYIQRRDPNRERLWKAVVVEGNKWAFIYRPLAVIDAFLLSVFPVLGYFCWNVVIVGKGVKSKK